MTLPEPHIPEAIVVELDAVDALAAPEHTDLFDASDATEAIIVDAVVIEAVAIEVDDPVVADLAPADPAGRPQHEGGHEHEGVRHLRVAPDGARRRRHVRIAAAGAAVSISATLFAVVGFNVELAQNQIKLQNLQHGLQSEQSRYYDLRSEVAARSAPSRIVAAAKRRGYVKAPLTYIEAAIKPPPPDPTGTSLLERATDATKGSLDPRQ